MPDSSGDGPGLQTRASYDQDTGSVSVARGIGRDPRRRSQISFLRAGALADPVGHLPRMAVAQRP
jgi:hypothetical protein